MFKLVFAFLLVGFFTTTSSSSSLSDSCFPFPFVAVPFVLALAGEPFVNFSSLPFVSGVPFSSDARPRFLADFGDLTAFLFAADGFGVPFVSATLGDLGVIFILVTCFFLALLLVFGVVAFFGVVLVGVLAFLVPFLLVFSALNNFIKRLVLILM